MALPSSLSSNCVRFIVITALGLKQASDHFADCNVHSIMYSYQLWLGHQIIYLFSLRVNQILFHLPYFFVTIVPNMSSLRLIGPLMVWNTYSCIQITVPNPFGHFKFLRIPVTALLSYLWRNNVYNQYYSKHVLICYV